MAINVFFFFDVVRRSFGAVLRMSDQFHSLILHIFIAELFLHVYFYLRTFCRMSLHFVMFECELMI